MEPSSSVLGRSGAAALLLLALASSAAADLPDHPAVARGPVPSWVEPADLGALRPAPPQASAAAYRLLDDQLWLDGDRSAVYTEWIVEVLNSQGLASAAECQLTLDSVGQRLTIHAAEVYRDGAWTDRLETAKASVLQREEELGSSVYDESLTLLMVLEDVRVGDLVRFAYTLEGSNAIFDDRFGDTFLLSWGEPVSEHRLRLVAAAGEPLFYQLHGGAPEPERFDGEGRQELRWNIEDLPAVQAEPDVPSHWVTYPFVQVSQFATWEEVADWGRALFAPQPLPAELAAVTAAIAEAHPDDPEARLLAASRWVQDEVRYFAMALGAHSHAPYDLSTIAQRRYGDCKDKTRLLLALLTDLGIDAAPALVNSGRDISRWQPSPLAFDHAVAVADLGGRPVWIDATRGLQGGASAADLYFPDYRWALELRAGTTALSEIPAGQTRPGTTEIRYDYRLTEAGEPFEVAIETTYRGSDAEGMRQTLAAMAPEELLDGYVAYYTDGGRTVEPLAPLALADDRDANVVTVGERYRVLGCWQGSGEGRSCDLLPLTMGSQLTAPSRLDRKAPLSLPEGLHLRETVAITATSPWDFSPVKVREDNRWFRFSVSSRTAERSIELIYELETLAEEVEPAALKRYVDGLETLGNSLGYSLQDGIAAAGQAEADSNETFETVLGCAILLALPLGLGVLILLIVFTVRRSQRASRRKSAPALPAAPSAAAVDAAPGASTEAFGKSAPALSAEKAGEPKVCPRCSAPVTSPERFCSRCGLELAPGKRRRDSSTLLIVGGAVGCFLLVPLIGIISAILIPNFIDALGKARHQRTVADLRSWSQGLETYRETAGSYPSTMPVDQLATVLETAGVAGSWPLEDPWKHPYVYACWPTDEGQSTCDSYRIASAGADGELEDPGSMAYESLRFARGEDLDRDIVFGPEGLIQGPEIPLERP